MALPRAWTEWARGWSWVKAADLFETVGYERSHELITLQLGMRPDQATDPARELRIARVEPVMGTLLEVPCQVSRVTRDAGGWQCRLTLFRGGAPAWPGNLPDLPRQFPRRAPQLRH